jgi:hypothetical protein
LPSSSSTATARPVQRDQQPAEQRLPCFGEHSMSPTRRDLLHFPSPELVEGAPGEDCKNPLD